MKRSRSAGGSIRYREQRNRDRLDFLGRLFHNLLGEQVHSPELVVLAPDLPGTPGEVLERGQLVERRQLARSRHRRVRSSRRGRV